MTVGSHVALAGNHPPNNLHIAQGASGKTSRSYIQSLRMSIRTSILKARAIPTGTGPDLARTTVEIVTKSNLDLRT